MTECTHCGQPIEAGERMTIHHDKPPTWINGKLISHNPSPITVRHERHSQQIANRPNQSR